MNKIVHSVLYIFLSLIISNSFAQQYNRPENNIWVYGRGEGLDFNNNPTYFSTIGIDVWEGSASVSNAQGQLLFYTDGDKIWDRNGNLMPNGNIASVYTGLGETANSSSQGALIVPFISDTNKYHVFSLTTLFTFIGYLPADLYHTIVDMSLNNGLGDVVPGQLGQKIDTSVTKGLTEKMIAIPGCDKVWLLRCQQDTMSYSFYSPPVNTYSFVATGITSSGINPVPVISTIDLPIGYAGYMVAAPDRRKVAIGSSRLTSPQANLMLADFDPESGLVFNARVIDTTISCYGVAFSPDNSKLYATHYVESGVNNNRLYQYEVNTTDPFSTRTLIATSDSSIHWFGALKLGPDDKIYHRVTANSNLAVINSPNLKGDSCKYAANASPIALTGRRPMGLPNEVAFAYVADTAFGTLDSLFCSSELDEGVLLAPVRTATGFNYLWNTGDSTREIRVNTRGIYWVRYDKECQLYTDTFHITGTDIFTEITIDVWELGTTGGPFASYQWYLNGSVINGANSSTYTIQENGEYTVEVTDSFGCAYVSQVYKVTNYSFIDDPKIIAETIKLFPNPAGDYLHINSAVPVHVAVTGIDGRVILKSAHTRVLSLSGIAAGIYLVKIMDESKRLLKVEKILKQ